MKNQLKAGIVLSYISTAISIIIQLIYMPLMIRLLGKSEFGLYSLVSSVVSYLSLFSLGFTGAYLRFFSKTYGDRKKLASLNGMFITLFIVLSGLACICGIVLSFFPEQIFGNKLSDSELQKARILMLILVFNIAITLISSIFDSIISAYEEFFFQRIVGIVAIITSPFISLPLLLIGYGSVMLVTVTTIVTVARLLVNIWYCMLKIKIPIAFYNFDWKELQEIFVFSFFILINMIIDQVNCNVDKLILAHTNGTEEVAVYDVAAQFNSLFMTFSTTISSVFSPRVNRIAVKKQDNYTNDFSTLMAQIGRIQWMILVLCVSGFVIFGRYFITNIYAGKEYEEAYIVTLLLVIPALIPWIQNIGIVMQRALNKHQFRSIIYFVMAVLNVILSIPMAEKYGVFGVTMGTTIAVLFGNGLIMNLFYFKVLKINMIYFWKEILKTWKGFILPALIGYCIIRYASINSIKFFIAYSAMYAMIYCVSIYLFSCNNKEKKLIRELLKKR